MTTHREDGVTAGHTKGAWYVLGDDEFDGVPFIEVSCGECPSRSYRSICHVQPTIDADADSFELDDEARANAAFIVRAVNCHGDLVAALKAVLNSDMAMREEDEGNISETLSIVRARLSEAAP